MMRTSAALALLVSGFVGLGLSACGSGTTPAPAAPAAPANVAAAAPPPAPAAPTTPAPAPSKEGNPLLQASTLPFHLPPFDKIKDTDFAPAFEAGMAEQRKEIDAIASATDAPTFDNTIVAMERSGRTLTRAVKAFFNLGASNTNETLEKVEAD